MKYILLFGAVISVAILILVGAIYIPSSYRETVVEIEPNTPAVNIAKILRQEGVINSEYLFLFYIRLTQSEADLSFGEYHFPEKVNLPAVVNKLRTGRVKLYPFTIIEGLTVWQTALSLKKSGLIDYDRFIELCENEAFIEEVTGLPLSTIEGFLYPNTYHFPNNASEEYIIRTMVKEFFRQLKTIEYDVNSLYADLILASIIEKEAIFNDEKPLISGVYHHRLSIGQRLQADPTVAYILEKEGTKKTIIYYRDLEVDSPYNTYKNKGLPPAPICNPAITSIEAAINPEKTDFLYFFADNDGRHVFSKTYDGHLKKQRTNKKETGNG